MFVIAQGNPFDGIILTGPFDSYEAALEYGESTGDKDWWIVGVESP